MSSVHDVATYILEQRGSMTAMKLQKLVYYSQAWHLAWDGVPMFAEPIEAWANGPVVPELFSAHRGQFTVSRPWPRGSSDSLSTDERETVDAVLRSYGHLSARELSLLTHSEDPWREARVGLGPTDRSNREISPERMQEFYGALDATEDAWAVEPLH